ncbi:MAG: CoA transferase [Anaerolineales bacterium]|nr:CoA transferase [Anaerolineales bacterium]
MLPLENVRVVDLTEALAGPYGAMLLGDFGADVIKIERPGAGDQSRRWGARLPEDESAYFCSTNRNKRSLTLNIQAPAGQAVLAQLLATADVFICNIPREDSLRRAGLDWETMHARFPRLIYVSITGYGRTGPSAGRSGYDLVAQGEAGLMSLTGTAATVPMRYPIPLADMTTGLYAVIGLLTALRVREQSGAGQHVDLSLLESQAAYLTIVAGDYFATGQPPAPIGNAHPSIVPYQVFTAADKDVIIAVGSDKQWAAFCGVLGLGPEVRDDPRFANNPARLRHRAELIPVLAERLLTRPAAELLAQLRAVEIPCGPINTVPDLLADPHYQARGNLVTQRHSRAGEVQSLANPIRLHGTPPAYRLPPPALGEHTDAVLTELGYPSERIAELRRDGVV